MHLINGECKFSKYMFLKDGIITNVKLPIQTNTLFGSRSIEAMVLFTSEMTVGDMLSIESEEGEIFTIREDSFNTI